MVGNLPSFPCFDRQGTCVVGCCRLFSVCVCPPLAAVRIHDAALLAFSSRTTGAFNTGWLGDIYLAVHYISECFRVQSQVLPHVAEAHNCKIKILRRGGCHEHVFVNIPSASSGGTDIMILFHLPGCWHDLKPYPERVSSLPTYNCPFSISLSHLPHVCVG
jgi:hypothetical protein